MSFPNPIKWVFNFPSFTFYECFVSLSISWPLFSGSCRPRPCFLTCKAMKPDHSSSAVRKHARISSLQICSAAEFCWSSAHNGKRLCIWAERLPWQPHHRSIMTTTEPEEQLQQRPRSQFLWSLRLFRAAQAAECLSSGKKHFNWDFHSPAFSAVKGLFSEFRASSDSDWDKPSLWPHAGLWGYI